MKRVFLGLVSALCLCWSVSGQTKASYEAGSIRSQEELAGVVRQLNDPGLEMTAMGKLLRFAGIFLGEGSTIFLTDDPKMDDLRRAAARAVGAHRSVDSVHRALYANDAVVRDWGVGAFEFTYGNREPWKYLLPRLEELASRDESASIRRKAIFKLGYYEESSTFLDALRKSPEEKDPSVLMELLQFGSQEPGLRANWYAHATRFLSDNDESVRWRWLLEIASNVGNPITAPMWKIEADPAMVEALRQIEKTGLPKEQELAGQALRSLGVEGEHSPANPG